MMNILVVIITSSLVATVVGVVLNTLIEHHKLKQSTKLAAMTAAVALEGYAITCADKVTEHKTANPFSCIGGPFISAVPDLPNFTVPAGFIRHRKAEIANRVMIFSQEVQQADQQIGFWWEVVGDEDAMRAEAIKQTSRIGLMSLDLARNIRSEFGLPGRELVFGKYDVRQVLAASQT